MWRRTIREASANARRRHSTKRSCQSATSIVRSDVRDKHEVDATGAYCKRPQQRGLTRQIEPTKSGASCTRCGRSPVHGRQHCPARDATKKKHFQSMCKCQAGDCGQGGRIPGCNYPHSCCCQMWMESPYHHQTTRNGVQDWHRSRSHSHPRRPLHTGEGWTSSTSERTA